jgi:hypothetical protein
VSERRGEGLRKRATRSSKLEERGGEGVESQIVKVQDLQEWTRRIGQPGRLPE